MKKAIHRLLILTAFLYFYNANCKSMEANIQEEIWKDIPGYEGFYEVSNRGQVRSLNRFVKKSKSLLLLGKLLKQTDNQGYLCVRIIGADGVKKSYKVHKLVAIVFLNHIPCGHKEVINHKDLNKHNNSADNLEPTTNRINCNLQHVPHTSKYTGVSWDKFNNKWRASILSNGIARNLGRFINEHDAHIAYENAVKSLS